jgi:hypothetical protein
MVSPFFPAHIGITKHLYAASGKSRQRWTGLYTSQIQKNAVLVAFINRIFFHVIVFEGRAV